MEMKSDMEEKKLHLMAKVHNFLEMLQGSQKYERHRRNLALKINK